MFLYDGVRKGVFFGYVFGVIGIKKRGYGSRLWIKIDQYGNVKILEFDKVIIMR